jgi:GTP-binding protein EngB required for normal cell division
VIRRRGPGVGLDARLLALDEAVRAADGVVDAPVVDRARAVLAQAGGRLGLGIDHTVVALAGATGSGKSSLFNALVGASVSTVGVRRPTTSRTSAAVWGEGADGLLDWLSVPIRHAVAAGPADPLDGLVLLDLPDHDSTSFAHRAEVDRVVGVADLVVWVLDPQKYADAAVHEGYLRPLASHRTVLLVVLNQADRLDDAGLAACRRDLARLLTDDGITDVPVMATSATTGIGVDDLRAELARRVAAREAAVQRLAADVHDVAVSLGAGCSDGAAPSARREDRAQLVSAMTDAAGVPLVTDAVAGSHRAAGARRVGWPFTRWVRRLRPDPLRRLHLQRGGGSEARTSLPAPSPVALARVDGAVRDLTDHLGSALDDSWADELRRAARHALGSVPGRLDAAVAGTDLDVARTPRWWTAVGALQWLLAVVAITGAAWLAVLAGLSYLRLGDVGTPDLGEVPLPTAMLLGGASAGVLVAALARPFVALGARRRARRAERRLRAEVGTVVDDVVLAPTAAVLDRHGTLCDAVRRAAR